MNSELEELRRRVEELERKERLMSKVLDSVVRQVARILSIVRGRDEVLRRKGFAFVEREGVPL